MKNLIYIIEDIQKNKVEDLELFSDQIEFFVDGFKNKISTAIFALSAKAWILKEKNIIINSHVVFINGKLHGIAIVNGRSIKNQTEALAILSAIETLDKF